MSAARGAGGAGPPRRPRGRPRSRGGDAAPEPIKALDRGVALLRHLAGEERATLTNIAVEAGLTPSSAYRILVTLQGHGLVEYDEATQEWAVGLEAYRIGSRYLARRGLLDVARPYMRELMRATGETANLAVADADAGEVVFVAQVEARHPVRAFHGPGTRGRLHASGIGKALLAELPAAEVRERLGTGALEAFTERTLAELPALLEDLERTRARGWSLDDEERHAGMRCIAAAIFDASGTAVAGVSISGPTARFPDAGLAALGARVRRSADDITRRLGGRAAPATEK